MCIDRTANAAVHHWW